MLVETTFIVTAVWVAAYVRLGDSLMPVIASDNGLVKMLLVAGAIQASMYFSGLYGVSVSPDRATLFIRLVQALAITSLVLAVLYYLFPNLIVGRGVFAIAAAFVFMLVMGWRLLFDFLSRRVAPVAH